MGADDRTSIERGALIAACALTVAAGYVDAVVFLRIAEVFTANQSGNLILGGVAAGGGRAGDVLLPAVSVGAYVAGAAAATWLVHRSGDERQHRLSSTSAFVAVALTAVAVVAAATGTGDERGPRTALVVALVVAIAAAMGAQGTAIRRVGGVPVLTTASTGSITSFGTELGRWSRDPGASSRAWRLFAVTACYVGGATLGALLATRTSAGAELLLGAAAVAAAVALLHPRLTDDPH